MTLLEPQTSGIPLPRPSSLTRPFWDGCKEGRLLFQRCTTCAAAIFDPALACRTCRGRDLVWEQSAGRGEIYSWTVAHRPLSPAFTAVYAPVIVTLDEGYRMISNIVGCDDSLLAVGLRVEVLFHRIDDTVLPYFRPA
ncbi:MAG TPA: OB-fold domain-containing protein [Mycobacteriales bacterium]|nr:OB-fold domain-containing protein [Mycobacteriales bacterium]